MVNEYEKHFGVKVNSQKSKVIIMNGSEDEKDVTWRLGETKLGQIISTSASVYG